MSLVIIKVKASAIDHSDTYDMEIFNLSAPAPRDLKSHIKMPIYEIEHVCPISPSQQKSLAVAITKIHTQKFTTPSFIVNVRFIDTNFIPLFVAGEQRQANFIKAHLRHGPGRTMEHYADVCSAIATAWGLIVGTTPELNLRGIFVLGDIITGWEAGFSIPPAGEDKAWLKQNFSAFQKLADAGNLEFQGLMHELQTREDLKAVLAS